MAVEIRRFKICYLYLHYFPSHIHYEPNRLVVNLAHLLTRVAGSILRQNIFKTTKCVNFYTFNDRMFGKPVNYTVVTGVLLMLT